MTREVLFLKKGRCECGALEVVHDLESGEFICRMHASKQIY